MATQFDALSDTLTKFIEAQHIFFCATAAPAGRVNLSPKGMDSLRVLGPNRIVWRNLTGSGNETAGHLARINRMTLMWCSFTTRPLILRAYGTARAIHADDDDFTALNKHFPPHMGARQIYDMSIETVQTSCGYAVPYFEHQGDRQTLSNWADKKGLDGVRDYWAEKNTRSLDGRETGILAN